MGKASKNKRKKRKPQYRPSVPDELKERLIADAGGKCANPGCPNRRTHIHHIKEWHVHHTHDERHMIAVCPSCHDAIHHGEIKLLDETVYSWKSTRRQPGERRHQIYVEPAPDPEIWVGGFAFVLKGGQLPLIAFTESNSIRVRVVKRELIIIDATLTSPDGTEIVRIRENNLLSNLCSATFESVPGRVRISAPLDTPALPAWLVPYLSNHMKPPFLRPEVTEITLFGAEVVAPGIVSVEGIWAQNDRCIIVHPKGGITFGAPNQAGVVTFVPKIRGETKFELDNSKVTVAPFASFFGFADEDSLFRLKNIDPTT